MAIRAHPPPAALLRLREADVVRLCGFSAASRGLEHVDSHAVTARERDGMRLAGVVLEGGSAEGAPERRRSAVRVTLPDEDGGCEFVWSCSQHVAQPGQLGCEHVAALLTAWIRSPAEFVARDTEHIEASLPPAPRDESLTGPETLAQSAQPRGHRPQPASMRDPASARSDRLIDALGLLPTSELLAMARRIFGTELALDEARDRLAATLRDPASLPTLLARLDQGPQALYAALQLLGGAITASDLDAMAERCEQSSARVRADMAVLARHGLVFATAGLALTPTLDERHEESHQEQPATTPSRPASTRDRAWGDLTGWRIPSDVARTLPMRLPLKPLGERSPAGPPAGTGQPEGSPALRVTRGSLRPLCLALALLARAPGPLGPLRIADGEKPIPGDRVTSESPFVLRGDLPARQVAALARAAGLDPTLTRLARRILLLAHEQAPTQPLTDLACVPSEERGLALRAAFRLWSSAETAGDLADLELSGSGIVARCDSAHAAFGRQVIAQDALSARRFVLRLLAAATPRAWYALDDLIELVWRLYPLFLRERQQAYTTPIWWLERIGDGTRQPLRPAIRDEWHAGEGTYLRQVLTQTLPALGVLDVGIDASGEPVAVRLASAGSWLLSDGQATAPAEVETALSGDWGPAVLLTREGGLAVQPLAARASLLGVLSRWAHTTGLAGGRLLLSLSPDLAAAAFDLGASPDELPSQLRAADPQSGGRVAESVGRQLRAWHVSYGATSLEEGWALLEARDEAVLLETLALVPGLAARCRRLDASLALVPPADLPSLQAALARRGHGV